MPDFFLVTFSITLSMNNASLSRCSSILTNKHERKRKNHRHMFKYFYKLRFISNRETQICWKMDNQNGESVHYSKQEDKINNGHQTTTPARRKIYGHKTRVMVCVEPTSTLQKQKDFTQTQNKNTFSKQFTDLQTTNNQTRRTK